MKWQRSGKRNVNAFLYFRKINRCVRKIRRTCKVTRQEAFVVAVVIGGRLSIAILASAAKRFSAPMGARETI